MTNTEIEKRLENLEAEVALLKSKAEKKDEAKTPWWEEIAGTFANDAAFDEAMRLGREYRESQKMVYDDEEE